MCWMNARNQPTLARTNRKATVTEVCGTNSSMPSDAPRTDRRMVSAYTNVPAKTPRVVCVTRLSRKEPITRGVNWLLASWSTTIVIENTRPVTEIIAEAIVPSRARAPSGPPWKSQGTEPLRLRSRAGRAIPSSPEPTVSATGRTQNGSHSRRHGLGRGGR